MNMQVQQLGQESHPFDVASMVRCSGISVNGQVVARPCLKVSAIVSAKAGDWSALAALVNHDTSLQLEIDINGHFRPVEVTGFFQDFMCQTCENSEQ